MQEFLRMIRFPAGVVCFCGFAIALLTGPVAVVADAIGWPRLRNVILVLIGLGMFVSLVGFVGLAAVECFLVPR